MSDEFISDRKTFCTILDRKEIFEISNNGFFISGHVTPEDMEMSEITLRIEWKHFRIPAVGWETSAGQLFQIIRMQGISVIK